MEYFIHIFIFVFIYGILALSLNLLVGYTGLLSITHAGFYGIGAYSLAILTKDYGFTFINAFISAIFITIILAFLIGIVLSKFKDDYYVLVSLGLNIIIFNIFLNWQELTRGPLGISGIDRPSIFGFSFDNNIAFLILCLIVLAITYFISYLITKSSFGLAIKGVREDEKALQIFGFKTHKFKMIMFIITAVMAAIAGILFATYISFIDPSTFTVNESILILSMIILGGMASLRGSVLGAFILIILPEALRFVGMPNDIAAQMRQVIYGLLLVLLMMYKPQGIDGKFKM